MKYTQKHSQEQTRLCFVFYYPSFARYVPTAITASAAIKIKVGHSANITRDSAAPINGETA